MSKNNRPHSSYPLHETVSGLLDTDASRNNFTSLSSTANMLQATKLDRLSSHLPSEFDLHINRETNNAVQSDVYKFKRFVDRIPVTPIKAPATTGSRPLQINTP